MIGTPPRPALPVLLGAFTNTTPDIWSSLLKMERTHAVTREFMSGFPWITTDPHEALELLQSRGLAPEDDVRREWECAWCANDSRESCLGQGHKIFPTSLPDLIAWASLGIPAILRAEELARETVARLRPWGCPQTERVVWRVGERRAVGVEVLAPDDTQQRPNGLHSRWCGTGGMPTPDGWPANVNNVSDTRLFWKQSNTGEPWWDCHAKAWTDPRPCPYDGMIALAAMGLWVDSITADAVTLVVPPVGAP